MMRVQVGRRLNFEVDPPAYCLEEGRGAGDRVASPRRRPPSRAAGGGAAAGVHQPGGRPLGAAAALRGLVRPGGGPGAAPGAGVPGRRALPHAVGPNPPFLLIPSLRQPHFIYNCRPN